MDELLSADFYLEDLKFKFSKINPEDYYLSYSGGRDSHFLLWFIKEYAHIDGIEVVGVNTTMEHRQILMRILQNSDVIIVPEMRPEQVKEKFGSPCFSKQQDSWIERWQGGSRRPYLVERITGVDANGEKLRGRFKLSKKDRDLLLDDRLHKVSPKCCDYLKKRPLHDYEKKSGRLPILGVRASESALRSKKYTSCFTKSGKFTPIHDLTDELLGQIESEY